MWVSDAITQVQTEQNLNIYDLIHLNFYSMN